MIFWVISKQTNKVISTIYDPGDQADKEAILTTAQSAVNESGYPAYVTTDTGWEVEPVLNKRSPARACQKCGQMLAWDGFVWTCSGCGEVLTK